MYQSLTDSNEIISVERLYELFPQIAFQLPPDNHTLEAFEIPYRNIDLDVLKSDKLEILDDAFKARVRGSFATSQGYSMQFDTSDSLKMQGAITLMETTGQTEGYLTQADDTTVYHVPVATMRAVLVEMLAAYAACHARKQELRAAINAAQTEDELAAIEIAWPV